MGEIEMTYNPDVVFPPGDTLDEVLAERGINQRELAERTGLHKKTISEIVRGKAPISPGVALKLETVLGIPARFWLTLEQQYQEVVAHQRGREELAREVGWLDRLPVAEMVSRGLVQASSDRVQQLQDVLTFFGIATPKQRLAVFPSFRRSQAFVPDDEATLVITRMVHGNPAKRILDAGWGYLVHRLTHKAANAGRVVVLVDPRYTSKSCSGCGRIVEGLTRKDRWVDCQCGDVPREIRTPPYTSKIGADSSVRRQARH